jgi:transcriptional regulator with XRE-family HTH domain
MGLRTEPTYRQRRFAAEVRALREKAGLSVAEAASVMGTHASHLSNIEAGRTSLSEERLRRLTDQVSSMDRTYVDALVAMGQSSGKGWWSEYRNQLRPAFLDFAELEAGAARLLTYEPMLIPGLLQSPEYASAVHRGGYAWDSQELQDVAVEFRMRRQSELEDPGAPRLHTIIHEAALHASFGSRQMMRDQLLRLIEVSRLPGVTIQILPFDGPVPFSSSFTVFEPSVVELSTVVVEHVEKSLYLGDADSVGRYQDLFVRLRNVALTPVDAAVQPEAHVAKDSLGLIQRLLYPLL